jgi:hypothetical protein
MRLKPTNISKKKTKLYEQFDAQPEIKQMESLTEVEYSNKLPEFINYNDDTKTSYSPPNNSTFKRPPDPTTYQPPDINLLNSSLPYITHIGYIGSDYTIDQTTGIHSGTINSTIKSLSLEPRPVQITQENSTQTSYGPEYNARNYTTKVSMIPINNKEEYNIVNRNDPDQILLMSGQDKIYPFGNGSVTETQYNKYKLSIISIVLASNQLDIKIPLYNDLRILYYAANSLLNDFTDIISNTPKYSNYTEDLNLLPLIKMIILGKKPDLDKSRILYTQNIYLGSDKLYVTRERNLTLDSKNTLTSSSPLIIPTDRVKVYNELCEYLNAYFQISTKLLKVDSVCFNFLTPMNNLPTLLQNIDCKNEKYIKKPAPGQSAPGQPAPGQPAPRQSGQPGQQSSIKPDIIIFAPFIVVGGIIVIGIIGLVLFFVFKNKNTILSTVKRNGGYYSYTVKY